jgi:hypothetical protein
MAPVAMEFLSIWFGLCLLGIFIPAVGVSIKAAFALVGK